MVRKCFTVMLMLLSAFIFAQDKGTSFNSNLNYSKSVEIYANLYYQYPEFSPNGKKIRFISNAAFQWVNKRYNFHEIGISDIRIHTTSNKDWYASLLYEYVINFLKHKEMRWVPALGIGVAPFVRNDRYLPKTTVEFPSWYYDIGTNIFVSPRVTYYFSKSFFVSLAVPLNFMKVSVQYQEKNNPSLPVDEQHTTVINVATSAYGSGAKLGLGWRF